MTVLKKNGPKKNCTLNIKLICSRASAFSVLLILGILSLSDSLKAEVATESNISKPEMAAIEDKTDPASGLDYFDAALKKHVNEDGMVDYLKFKSDRAELDKFLDFQKNITTENYDTWDNKEKLAFWINAYNSLTLESVLNHYPIKSVGVNRFLHPKNSIRQIPGVWKGENHTLLGKKISLDQIEHQVIRKEFLDWRIHMALVCAAQSCPPLRSEAFRGAILDKQLDDQTKRFLESEANFSIKDDSLFLSSIFKWFAQDFPKSDSANFPRVGNENQRLVVLELLSFSTKNGLGKPSDWDNIQSIKFFAYDWSLNDQPQNLPPSKPGF